MYADEAQPGVLVRYPRTGTTGTIVKLEKIKGEMFAELDSTSLFYRVDQLIKADKGKGKGKKKSEQDLAAIRKEREAFSGMEFQEAIANTDQSCEGGG